MDVRRPPVSLPYALALLTTAALFATAASPGWLSPESGAVVRRVFSGLCHQLPDRSPHLGGGVWALCHRCSGIAAGLVLGLAAAPLLPGHLRARLDRAHSGRLVVLSLVPMAVDWSLGAAGVWANTPVSRALTGALFGVAAGAVLALALTSSRPAPSLSPDPRSCPNLLSP